MHNRLGNESVRAAHVGGDVQNSYCHIPDLMIYHRIWIGVAIKILNILLPYLRLGTTLFNSLWDAPRVLVLSWSTTNVHTVQKRFPSIRLSLLKLSDGSSEVLLTVYADSLFSASTQDLIKAQREADVGTRLGTRAQRHLRSKYQLPAFHRRYQEGFQEDIGLITTQRNLIPIYLASSQ